jgi:hypothetical protein
MMVSRFFGSLFNGPSRDSEQGTDSEPLSDIERIAVSLGELQGTVRLAGRDLPTSISSQLRQIEDILEPLPQYMSEHGASTEQQVLLEAIIGDYIATPLKKYLAASEPDRLEGSSATALLSEQLVLLFSTAQDLNLQIRSGAITELATYARFLNDKFEPSMLSGGSL